ncbi:hypothetical protein [Aeromonas intestinalis]
MGWLRKVWAALVVLFTRQEVPSKVLASEPLAAAPTQPLDYPDLHISHGSPLKAVIDQLDRVFPAPVIKPGAVLDDLQYKAGQRAVVDWLRQQQVKQQQRGKT